MVEIAYAQSQGDFNKYLENDGLVAYFTAAWCGPCQAIKPLVDQIYGVYPNIEVVKVDIDKLAGVASKYSITSVPTFVFFHKKNIVEQVRGADPKGLEAGFEKLSKLSVGKRIGNGPRHVSPLETTLKSFIPKGYEILNDSIDFNEVVNLNVVPFNVDQQTPKVALRLLGDDKKEIEHSTIATDVDGQGIIYVPFTNVVKVYSILIKLTDELKFDDKSEFDLSDDWQKVDSLSVWKNLTGAIAFEEANSSSNNEHLEKFDLTILKDGWYEIKLKFVRFQKVKNLNLFFQGEDEDAHTVLEKIVFIGINGESQSQQTLADIESDEHDH